MAYKYPLQTDNFSFWDRLKVCKFILNKNNRLTAGPKVEEFEKEWENISGAKCIATSSGSTANHLLLEVFLQTNNLDPKNVTVFCPATTWASSVSPWLFRGCEVVFVDINLKDFSFNYDELEYELMERDGDGKIKVIWPTALIGFPPNIDKLNELKREYKTYLFADL
jgi:dTDP-4-amino-4,6-dideoxygalactose transaminase